ncbi:hypothetical protein DFH09DRAFT_348953 [Mycena vulgaris]|nr:hypothetical protein DFH09DRAFT_348953 [Mycena vulgaris]
MDIFMSTSSCRSVLRRACRAQGSSSRTFSSGATGRDQIWWKSPVFCNIKQRPGTTAVPDAVTTLDPARISPSNFFDISQSSLRSEFRKMSSKQVSDAHSRQFGNQISTSSTPFPPETRGFLYYHSPPNQSPLAGGIRFRVATDADQRSFVEGHDLLINSGLPWNIPIWELCTLRQYGKLRKILISDGFAPRELISASEAAQVCRDSVFVTALGQPWAVSWKWEYSRVYIVAPGRPPVATLIRHPWFSHSSVFKSPYLGRGLVSMVKNSDGKLGLRIDKVINVRQDAINLTTPMPTEGAVAPFVGRLIRKQTKMSEKEMDLLVEPVHSASGRLPWVPAKSNPMEVYRHHGLSREREVRLGWAEERRADLQLN